MITNNYYNRKSVYKLCRDYKKNNNMSVHITRSLYISFIGSNIAMWISDKEDNKVTITLKTFIFVLASASFLNLMRKIRKKDMAERKLKSLFMCLETINLSNEEFDRYLKEINKNEFCNKISEKLNGYKYEEIFDENSFTFILYLNEIPVIKEIFNEGNYSCYYVDQEKNEKDITSSVKKLLYFK